MKTETKADLEKALGHKVDETDIKIFEILQECGESKEAQTVHGFSVDFGKKCFEMGKSFSRADIIAKVNGPLKDELDRILGDDDSNL